jgi:hypothetical protein
LKEEFMFPPFRKLIFQGAGAVALILGAAVGPAGAGDPAPALKEVSSPHFVVQYQSAYPPAGILNDLESLHVKLMLDLNDFVPWAQTEKVHVVLYKDAETYRRETGIRAWAGGHVVLAQRRVYTFESEDFRRVMAHELAHLFLEDFFARKNARPPSWLTEGIATLMERDYGVERSQRLHDAAYADQMEPLAGFFAFDYHHQDRDAEAMSLWYRQAYSVVRFLMRLSSVQFFLFCSALRDGKTLDQSLALAYGVQVWDVPSLETLWRRSLTEK